MKKILTILFAIYSISANAQIITTVAGTGTIAFRGDGGPATMAELYQPWGAAVDGAGNIYIADYGNNRIRKINTSGIITTFAGNGTSGFSGDGGPAIEAELKGPTGIVVDGIGNVYFADQGNYRIRKVNTSGVIITVAGNGISGYSGDGAPAIAAGLSPWGVAVDGAGNIYISDYYNSRIRKVNTSGIISTIAGNGNTTDSGNGGMAILAEVYYPEGMASDFAGNVFFIQGNSCVRKINTSGIIDRVAGSTIQGYSGDGGIATIAKLHAPMGIALDMAGNLYIADSENYRIRKVNASGIINTIAGNGTDGFMGDGSSATSGQLSRPSGITIDAAGNVFIADNNNNRIRKVNTSGIITTIAGNGIIGFSGEGGLAVDAEVGSPTGIAVDGIGNIYMAIGPNHRILKVSTSGILTTIAGNGTAGFSGDGGPAALAQINYAEALAVDPVGNVFIADRNNRRIRKINTSGIISTVAGTGSLGYSGDGGAALLAEFSDPIAVAVDKSGNIFIADQYNQCVRKVDFSGTITTFAGNGTYGYSGDGGAAATAQLNNPIGLTTDETGNVYISDGTNSRIRCVDTLGIITTAAIISSPREIAVDKTGNLYIGRSGSNQYVYKINTSGIITTVAGNGTTGYSGDGGNATAAQLCYPAGVALDGIGNIYIADRNNHRVRKVSGAVVSDTIICTGNSASLFATGIGTIGWYSAATGGTYLGGGSNYITPVLTTSTTYFVQDSTSFGSSTRSPLLVTVSSPTVTTNTTASILCAGNSVTLTGGGASTYTWTGGITNGISFIPSATTTYTVLGTDANNCSDTDSITIIINPLPIVTANTTVNTICVGTFITLTGGGAFSYSWTGGVTDGIAFAPSSTTTFAVLGIDGNGCYNTATITINVDPAPDLTTNLSGTVITANQTEAIYQWLDCNNSNSTISGATNQSYTSISGNYAVVVTLNGCLDTSMCVNVIIAGIEETTNNIQLTVYPNPSTGAFIINSTNEGTYSILNELGQTIQSFKLNGTNNYMINIENLDSGIYFIVGKNRKLSGTYYDVRQKIVVMQ